MPSKARSRKKKHDRNDDLDEAREGNGSDHGFSMLQNPDDLAKFVREEMGVHVASSALTDGSDGPLAYLVHSFFEGRFTVLPDGSVIDHNEAKTPRPPGDCVVWANRGGGKTFLGAVATALDMIFKPTIEIRILGGSAEQSRRMHEHLCAIFEREQFQHLLDGRTTENRVRLISGSRAEILSHSERSVRGVRVQKLRCDEVDLFDDALWKAAQLVTRSHSPINGPWGTEVRGVIEVLSTMHVPMGMMWGLTREAGRVSAWRPRAAGATDSAALGGVCGEPAVVDDPAQTPSQSRGRLRHPARLSPSRVLFKWGVVDSLERCDTASDCDTCSLKEECGGKAKDRTTGGHMTVRDARVLKQRCSQSVWRSEMLCREPSRHGCVFAGFSPDVHVLAQDVPLAHVPERGTLVAGMDFGVRAPTVILWAHATPEGVLTVIDEYAEEGRTLSHHISALRERSWGEPAWISIDPAGIARNEQTGVSNYAVMRNSGLGVRARRCSLGEGLEAVRNRLTPAEGPPTLRISPRCARLIEALARYHYPVNRPTDPTPEKDGHDHWCDALRYMVVGLEGRGVGVGRSG